MFVSTRDQGNTRRTRPYSVSKRYVSSRTSLLSNLTTSSGESAGSSSTITQESFLRSERARRRKHSHSTKSKSSRGVSSGMRSELPPRKDSHRPLSNINVFSFLEEPMSLSHMQFNKIDTAHGKSCDKASVQDELDGVETTSTRSHHSDSGISINDSLFDAIHPASFVRSRLDSLPDIEESEGHDTWKTSQCHNQEDATLKAARLDAQARAHMSSLMYHHPQPMANCLETRTVAPQTLPPATTTDGGPHQPTSVKLSGYDLLASRLSKEGEESPKLGPIYRRFSQLNHRILLQLQDEIAEMEVDLTYLDNADTLCRQRPNGDIIPASRRNDWQWNGSEIRARRLDLLGRISVKIDQYNQAIFTFQRTQNHASLPRSCEINEYRQWLNEHHPLAEPELKFLDDETDLLSLDARPFAEESPGKRPSEQVSCTSNYACNFPVLISVAGVWLITCTSSVRSRWMFLLLLAGATAVTQPDPLNQWNVRAAVGILKAIAFPLAFWLVVTLVC